MYIIIVYDVNIKRVNKVKSFLRRYLYWVQNSVFEGELTQVQYIEVIHGLEELIKVNDNVIIYILNDKKLVNKQILGRKKNNLGEII